MVSARGGEFSRAVAIPRIVVLVIVLAMFSGLVTAITVVSPQRAWADPAGSTITVVIDRLTPVVPEPGDTLRVNGRLVNTSGAAISGVSVRLGLSASPLTARNQIDTIAGLELNPETDPIDYFFDRTRFSLAKELAPGDEQRFELTAPVNELPLGKDGVYPLMVEVLGNQVGVGEVRRGGLRTFLPWMTTNVDPINLVWLWPLSDYPAREATGVLLNEQTPRELAPGGRLDSLLTLGANNPGTVSFIADSQLLQGAQDISGGYQVQSGDTRVVGDLSEAAASWLSRLTSVLSAATNSSNNPTQESGARERLPLRVLPYADIDAVASWRADLDGDVVRATTMSPTLASNILGRNVLGSVYWAPEGRINKKTGDLLSAAGVRTIIVSSNALPPRDPAVQGSGLGVLGTSFGGMTAVVIDQGLADTLALNQRSKSGAIQMRQRFLAETALISQLIPEDASSRTIVAAPNNLRWNPSTVALNSLLEATGTAPWLNRASLSGLLTEGASALPRERGGYGARVRAAELPASYLQRVRTANSKLASFTSVLNNPTGLTDSYAEAILRAQSSAWRTELNVGNDLVDSILADLNANIAQVYALSEGTITLSGEQGLVPVTIANDLDRTVTVGVVLRGFPSARLDSDPLTDITIEAGKKVSVELQARVVGGQSLATGVQLLTPEGDDFGSPAMIELVSTAYAQAAAWVIALAFTAIVIFVVVGIFRRIHKATQKEKVEKKSP